MHGQSWQRYRDPDTNGSQRDPNDAPPTELEEYHLAKQIKLPSQVPASAGGLNKTSKTPPVSPPMHDLRFHVVSPL